MVIINIFFFVLSPILSLVILIPSLIIDYRSKYYIFYIFMIAMALALIGSNIIPIRGLDGFVYREQMIQMQNITYLEAYKNINQFRAMPVIYTLFYLVAQTGVYSLAPFVSVLLTYSIILYIFIDYSRLSGCNKFTFVISTLTVLSWVHYLSIVSGMRFNIGYSLIALGLYLEFIKKRSVRIVAILYIMAILTHSSLYIFVILRVLMLFYKTKAFKIIMVTTLIAWSSLSDFFIEIISKYSANVIINNIVIKYHAYEQFYAVTNQNARIFLYLQWGYAVGILLITMYLLNKNNIESIKYKKYIVYVQLVSLFTIGGFGNDIFIIRYSMVLIVLSSAVLILFLSKLKGAYRALSYALLMAWILLGLYNQKGVFDIPVEKKFVELVWSNILSIYK